MSPIGHIVIDLDFLIKYSQYLTIVNGQPTLNIPADKANEMLAHYAKPIAPPRRSSRTRMLSTKLYEIFQYGEWKCYDKKITTFIDNSYSFYL
jgi:hypothetical protein